VRRWFGDFREIAPLGFSFACALGCYWMLRTMKNALFMELVGPEYLPTAKLASMGFLLVTLVLYGKLVDWLGKRRLLGILYMVYAALFAGLTWIFSQSGRHPTLGWGFYLSIESFGSLGISHLWSLAVNATHDPQVAARRFPMLAVCGQLGAIACTLLLATLAPKYGLVPLLLLSSGLLFVAPVMALRWLQANRVPDRVDETPQSTGMLEGLRLVGTRPYLSSILWIVLSYELVGTFLDYQMNTMAKHHLNTLGDVTRFLGMYGFAANSVSFLFALTGTSFLVRRLGLSLCLVLYPTVLAVVVLTAASFPSLWVFFAAQIALKGAAYGFNKPCLELLYVPTTDTIQFKAKSWIDTAGSRGGKSLGSLMNGSYPTDWLIWAGAATCLAFLAVWAPIARRLGKSHSALLESGKRLS
jgi:AAA family ATP:ADP antiporter